MWFHAVIIGAMEKCYGSCIAFSFFVVNSLASLVWYHLYSTAIPPVVLKTNGVNEACSTSNTQLVYWHFFSVLCCLNIWSFKPQYPHTNSPNISFNNKLREFDKRSRHFPLGDHFFNSHNLLS